MDAANAEQYVKVFVRNVSGCVAVVLPASLGQ